MEGLRWDALNLDHSTAAPPHTARHTLVTKAQEQLGIAGATAGAVVGHKKSFAATDRNYTHFATDFLTEAATATSGEIAPIMGFGDLIALDAESSSSRRTLLLCGATGATALTLLEYTCNATPCATALQVLHTAVRRNI